MRTNARLTKRQHDAKTAAAIAAFLATNAPTKCRANARALAPGQLRRADAYGVSARGHAPALRAATLPNATA